MKPVRAHILSRPNLFLGCRHLINGGDPETANEKCPIRTYDPASGQRAAAPRNGLGGADRDRTGDPLLAKQVLSQLSYSPKN